MIMYYKKYIKIRHYIREIGIICIITGLIRKKRLKRLQMKYCFDSWHLYPIEHRSYATWIVNYINSRINVDNTAVEIGCGLGEIINSIKCKNKCGYDICDKVISAANELFIHHLTRFEIGTFKDVNNLNIDYLIVVNFTAMIDPITLKAEFKNICKNNRIHRVVVESVNATGYTYCHDFSNILPENFIVENESKVFYPLKRIIWVYKNSDLSE